MVFTSNKEKGNTSLGMAIAYFASQGYTVSIPLNDTQNYDLVIEKNNTLQTVQVKSSGCINKSGHFQVALKSCGGTKGKTYKTFKQTNVDLLFIFLQDSSMYLIPSNKINNNSTLTISNKYKDYLIKF